ncbi:MAG: agmatinase [Fervidicoccaceae archaeon]
MSWRLRLERGKTFANFSSSRDRTKISIIGAPLDISNSHAPGTMYAPDEIRKIAESLEWYSFISERDLTEFGLHDEGNLVLYPGEIGKSIDLISEALSDLRGEGRIPFLLGGEHTVSIASSRIVSGDCLVIVFDAHLDLRDEYLGSYVNHATAMRRLWERSGSPKFAFIGTRAVSPEELEFARKEEMEIFTSRTIWKYGSSEAVKRINRMIEEAKCVYISFDMDVVDPGFAPGVGTPEPLGLEPNAVAGMLVSLVGEKLIGFDMVEVNPMRDCGEATSALAAKLIIEAIIKYEISRKAK